MDDLRHQLEILRARVRAIQERQSIQESEEADEPLDGFERETLHGHHFEREVAVTHHGGFDLSRVAEITGETLAALTDGERIASDPGRWAFLDTETTGLAGGSGTCAFLVGVGRVEDRGFRVKQYFMRDFDEEASLLSGLTDDLADCDVLITYNGRSYDQPLLESRYVLARQRPPFARLTHIDLLYGARRIWKMRFESCRQIELENRILGYERQGDVPGMLIPQLYFDYLRHKRMSRLKGVFHHNVLDILSLAGLTAIVPQRFADPRGEHLAHAAEMVGLGRWLYREGRREEAIALFERAITRIEYDRLPEARRLDVLLALAKHHEHATRDLARALAMTEQALEISGKQEWIRREARIRRKLNQAPLSS